MMPARTDTLAPLIANIPAIQTTVLQQHIDRCAKDGGGAVRILAGVYRTGTLRLASGVSLHLERGAVLLGSDRLEDYPVQDGSFVDAVGQVRGRCLILAQDLSNVAIEGEGIIDGNGAAFCDGERYHGRPFLLRLIGCTNVRIEGITFRNSAAWVIHLIDTRRATLRGLTIHSHVNHNNDGIDIDSCQQVLVESCDIDCGDDAVCLKTTKSNACEDITVRNCTLRSDCCAIKIGTESYADIRRIRIMDCDVLRGRLCGIKVLSADGASIDDVVIERIRMCDVTGPIFVRLGERGRTYDPGLPTRQAGSIRRLVMCDITADVIQPIGAGRNYFTGEMVHPRAFSGIHLVGLPYAPISEVTLEKITVCFEGGGHSSDRVARPAQRADAYPEHFYFGVKPAFAVCAEHVDHLVIRDCEWVAKRPDCREAQIFADVAHPVVDRVRVVNGSVIIP